MNDLIEALQLIGKYLQPDSYAYKCPTTCHHNVLWAGYGIEHSVVTAADLTRLHALGFDWDEGRECFRSYRFGGC